MATRPFLETARDIRQGQYRDDCADELQKVITAVADTGKKATLTIQIDLTPASKGNGAVVLSDRINAKLPTDPPGETIFFVTPHNNLTVTDPRQAEVPGLRDVNAPPERAANA